jgi:hypothetical protein
LLYRNESRPWQSQCQGMACAACLIPQFDAVPSGCLTNRLAVARNLLSLRMDALGAFNENLVEYALVTP